MEIYEASSVLSSFKTISLEEMKGIKLMNRIDTKFVTTTDKLRSLLSLAASDYFVQQINDKRISAYSTVYFDTPDYNMFYVHQTGHANRQKLRFRTYTDSNLQFMEVKTKNNHGRTKKKRIRVTDMDLNGDEKLQFLSQYLKYDTSVLNPALQTKFDRITLVNQNKTERLTIDTNITFNNIVHQKQNHLQNLVVIELKRDGLSPSPVLSMLRQLRIFPHGFSKYCMGQMLTNNELRINRFKQKMRGVEKILKS